MAYIVKGKEGMMNNLDRVIAQFAYETTEYIREHFPDDEGFTPAQVFAYLSTVVFYVMSGLYGEERERDAAMRAFGMGMVAFPGPFCEEKGVGHNGPVN